MPEPTKMEAETPKKEEKEKEEPTPIPPLEAAARRLERLLGGGLSEKDRNLHTYTNPAKVVRRWLGTASGAAGNATLADIAAAASTLLDPEGPCAAFVDAPSPTDEGYLTVASCREVESWFISLSIRLLRKEGEFSDAFALVQKGILILLEHLNVASTNPVSSSGVSSSSLFPLLARMYRYRSLVTDVLKDQAINATLRQDMAKAHNMACLRRDVDCQATLLNLMLQDLIVHSQSKSLTSNVYGVLGTQLTFFWSVEQAQKLLSNSTFPESASNNQLCRYLYHSGRIQALRLEYTKAFSNLSQCLRKAPTNTGLGFRIAAQRLLVVVQLLMGEIPERHVFFTKGMQTELAPYLAITQAVRRGDLAVFKKVISEQASRLQQDQTYTLISRLAHQVVKAGLRKLHLSYSRLSLQDVADRLGLPSATSAEFVVAKAVRDGVLDATIHHEEGYVQSHDLVDVYATKEPAEAFHRRIAYCLTTHNDAVRGMRYPPDAYKKQLEASRGNRRKRNDDKTDEEKAQELEDELEDEY
jgi:26S proteasome regulatory subunit N3